METTMLTGVPNVVQPSPDDALMEMPIEVMTFAEDGAVLSNEGQEKTHPETINNVHDNLRNDVVGFLSRPVELATVDWTTSQVTQTQLYSCDIPLKWLQAPMINLKAQGFTFLRCNFVFKVEVNAQPFNAGMLLLWFCPLSNCMQNSAISCERHLGGKTGLNSQSLNIFEGTAAELHVPFTQNISHFDLVDGLGSLGRFHVAVYSPLTGGADVDFTIFVHATDVDIQLPTGKGLAVQPVPYRQAQMGLKEEKKSTSTISGMAKKVGSIAKGLSVIPGLGAITEPVAAAADLAGGVASLFGFSKPQNDATENSMRTSFDRHFATSMGVSNAKVMALDPRQAVEPQPSLGRTNEDEMTIQSIIKNPVYLTSFRIDKNDPPGKLLWKWNNHPSSCQVETVTVSTATFNLFNETYLSYLSRAFAYWRGGITYTLKFVKTPFQSGRIKIWFVPGAKETDTAASFEQDYCYSILLDVRDLKTYSFTIPYLSNTPWLPTRAALDVSEQVTNPTGVIYISNVNAMRNPSAAADSYEVIVEQHAADDFQFAMFEPWTQAKIVKDNELVPTFNAQMDFIPTKRVSDEEPIGKGVGEAIVSLRECLKRNIPYSDKNIYDNGYPVYPDDYNVYEPTIGNLVSAPISSAFVWFAQLYRWWYGSIRWSVFQKARATEVSFWSMTTAGNRDREFSSGTAIVGQVPVLERNMEMEFPFYQPVIALPTLQGRPFSADPLTKATFDRIPSNGGPYVSLGAQEEFDNVTIYTSIGEDFGFAYRLGPPRTAVLLPPPPTPS